MILKSRQVAPVACLAATGVARHKKFHSTNITRNSANGPQVSRLRLVWLLHRPVLLGIDHDRDSLLVFEEPLTPALSPQGRGEGESTFYNIASGLRRSSRVPLVTPTRLAAFSRRQTSSPRTRLANRSRYSRTVWPTSSPCSSRNSIRRLQMPRSCRMGTTSAALWGTAL